MHNLNAYLTTLALPANFDLFNLTKHFNIVCQHHVTYFC
jgi:hypothetical protein